jgi:stage III sporulation protein AA
MFWVFSKSIGDALKKLEYNKLTEIRIRNSKPVKILYDDKWGYLGFCGFTSCKTKAIISRDNEAQYIAISASENSLYSVYDNIARGFLTLKNGCRIGLCGEAVTEKGELKTFKNFSSATIRIPHEINGSPNKFIYRILDKSSIKNTLIISPPGGGKTTVLRDLAKELSERFNVVIIDERFEMSAPRNGVSSFNVGESDVICGCKKNTAIENAVRSCAPDIIITDEISSDDYQIIRQAVSSGVKVISSIHSSSIDNLLKKPNFEKFFSNKIFDLFIVLEGRDNPGKCVGIFDENFNRIE